MKLLIGALAAILLSGCGAGSGPSGPAAGGLSVAVGPHGGDAVPLPGEAGYAEVVVEPLKGRARQSVLAVYFLQKDLKTALAEPPSGVAAKVTTPEEPGPRAVDLKAEPDPAKPVGAGRFASGPGQFDYDELTGELTVTIGGQTATRAFRRR